MPRFTVPNMLTHVQRGPWNGHTLNYYDTWLKPVECPECGNANGDNFDLYSTDLDTCRWYSLGNDPETGVMLFDYGKSVHTESSSDPDTLVCRDCNFEFEATNYAYDLA